MMMLTLLPGESITIEYRGKYLTINTDMFEEEAA